MIIRDLFIDGFGVWNDVTLNELDGGLTLLYGENETGKTTLLEFMRSVLYGFSDERRAKYLPPVHGGMGGGMLAVEAAAGKFKIRRRTEGDPTYGRLDLTNLQGTAQDSRLLKKIIADLDEQTFQNVFALGLGEIQELSSLSGAGAAEFLYDLAVGSGGVSLTEVHRELENSRNRLFSSERNSTVGQLLDRRSKLKSEIEHLRQHGRGYALLADERQRLAGDVERCEVESDELRRNAELLETAVAVHERWHRRIDVEAQLGKLADLQPIADDVWQKLAQLKARYNEQRPQIERLKKERADARKQAAAVRVNTVVWQQGPRIEVLAAQESWIESLENEIRRLEQEGSQKSSTVGGLGGLGGSQGGQRRESLSSEWVKLGLTPASAEKLGDRKAVLVLQRAFREHAAAEKRLANATDIEARRREIADAAAAEEAKVVTVVRRESHGSSLDEKSQLVGNLRKRVQLDQKIDQLTGHRDEAQRHLREKLALNTVPADVIFNPGVFVTVGMCAFLSGIFLPDSVVGDGVLRTFLTIAGGAVALFAGAFKIMRDTSNNEQLDQLRRQARTIEAQLHELNSEREQLDALIPAGGGPMLARLQTAERELAQHEETTASEQVVSAPRRSVVREDLEEVRVELRVAQEEAAKTQKQLRQQMERFGLPERMTWSQIRTAAKTRARHELNKRKEERRQKYLAQRRSELALVADRIAQLFVEAQIEPQGERLVDHLHHLIGEWKRNEDLLERRKNLRQEYKIVDRRLKAARRDVSTIVRRRKALLRSQNVTHESELQARREQLQRRATLQNEYEALSREILAALGAKGQEDDLRSRYEQYTLPQLEQRWTELCDRLAALEKRLRELYEEQGRLQQKLDAISADRSLPKKIYELKNVERQIEETLEKWEHLTVAQRLLEAVRKKYEAERQPETLREASRYFDRLTEGKYKRVWTPLEAGVLFVDTAPTDGKPGETLKVEVLSRGTREQLFLALRLALVDLYARRGKVMPLVLDDVLVNFDTRRTRLAAELLCDFANDHKQVLLFTCHEHIYRLFRTLRSDVRLLPGQFIDEEPEGPVRIVEKVVEKEKIVEKVVKVKEPVYLPAPAAELPPTYPLPSFDGAGVFHMPPPRRAAAPPPPPPPPVAVAEPEYEDVVEEVVVEPTARTIVQTRRLGYPVVPMWTPDAPFAGADWQDTVTDQTDAAANGKH
jgi:uncharacterized protein YhaN